ncbi:fimbrial protein [Pseudomonas fluorescens]|nr:fimbrial protein [Pseudomonas fluorescens]
MKLNVLRHAPWGVLAFTIFCSPPLMAACSVNRNAGVEIATIVVPRDAAIGSLVGEGTSATIQPYTCTGTNGSQQFGIKSLGTKSGLTSAEGAIIYRLGPQSTGIGYTIQGIGAGVCPGTAVYDDGVEPLIAGGAINKLLCDSGASSFATPITGNIKFRLYKIANSIPGGTIPTQPLAVFILRTDNKWTPTESQVLISSVAVSVAACSVTNTNIAVPMGSVKTTDFSTEGSTAGTTAFTVPLSCDANTRVGITLNAGGAGASDSTRGILNLDSSESVGVATGVKLQMLYKDTPVALNTMIQTGTVTTTGAYNIPFKARYYRSTGSISAGQANASATLTITYQ